MVNEPKARTVPVNLLTLVNSPLTANEMVPVSNPFSTEVVPDPWNAMGMVTGSATLTAKRGMDTAGEPFTDVSRAASSSPRELTDVRTALAWTLTMRPFPHRNESIGERTHLPTSESTEGGGVNGTGGPGSMTMELSRQARVVKQPATNAVRTSRRMKRDVGGDGQRRTAEPQWTKVKDAVIGAVCQPNFDRR